MGVSTLPGVDDGQLLYHADAELTDSELELLLEQHSEAELCNIAPLKFVLVTLLRNLNSVKSSPICHVDAQFNNITSLEAFSKLRKLKNLNLIHNRIKNLRGIENLQEMTKCRVSHNNINSLGPLLSCKGIRELWINGNDICMEELESLKALPDLRSLVVSPNPCCLESKWRETIIRLLPQIEILDGQSVAEFASSKESEDVFASELVIPREHCPTQVSRRCHSDAENSPCSERLKVGEIRPMKRLSPKRNKTQEHSTVYRDEIIFHEHDRAGPIEASTATEGLVLVDDLSDSLSKLLSNLPTFESMGCKDTTRPWKQKKPGTGDIKPIRSKARLTATKKGRRKLLTQQREPNSHVISGTKFGVDYMSFDGTASNGQSSSAPRSSSAPSCVRPRRSYSTDTPTGEIVPRDTNERLSINKDDHQDAITSLRVYSTPEFSDTLSESNESTSARKEQNKTPTLAVGRLEDVSGLFTPETRHYKQGTLAFSFDEQGFGVAKWPNGKVSISVDRLDNYAQSDSSPDKSSRIKRVAYIKQKQGNLVGSVTSDGSGSLNYESGALLYSCLPDGSGFLLRSNGELWRRWDVSGKVFDSRGQSCAFGDSDTHGRAIMLCEGLGVAISFGNGAGLRGQAGPQECRFEEDAPVEESDAQRGHKTVIGIALGFQCEGVPKLIPLTEYMNKKCIGDLEDLLTSVAAKSASKLEKKKHRQGADAPMSHDDLLERIRSITAGLP